MSLSRIMCVDDSPEILASLSLALEVRGFAVTTACHGIDALGKFKAELGQFDAIVTDNDMPQMNGLELVRILVNDGFVGRIVVMSGNLKPEDIRAYQAYPISGFLKKPFELRSILATLLEEN